VDDYAPDDSEREQEEAWLERRHNAIAAEEAWIESMIASEERFIDQIYAETYGGNCE
jgi:hypothetical protein